ncbi:integrase catalytic domain-containing protein [Trichonephila clavipes]|nr:integrase catalytic domain-containing protein [Trichonephila clavipes]
MMGDLPIERINPCRAFDKVGIDFAGSITTKCQHTRKANNFKSYICLFICMCTKAVHLDLVSSLSAAAFLSALRRFVSRCGYPTDIYSDNGTNFIGASAYLKDLFQLLHNSNVQDYSSSKNIQWHFIPPYAPNFGGVWEASVKLTKQHLLKTLKAAVLNFEELDTILCQIEACINSRHLYPLSSDPKDLQVLTPGHFLIGCPLLELPDHSLSNQSLSIHSTWSLLMKLKKMFWSRWKLSYLNTLQSRTKWMQVQKDLTVGSLVLIKNPASFSTRWTPGRIVATHPRVDGICRVVTIQTSSGVMTRPVSQELQSYPYHRRQHLLAPRRMLRTVDSFRLPEMAPRTGNFFIIERFVIGGKNAIRFVYVCDGSIVFFVIVLCNVFLHVIVCLCVLFQNSTLLEDDVELHSFSDASKKAYGAAIYLRTKSRNGISVKLVTSKSRVAPLNCVTLPRLELLGALVAAHLASKQFVVNRVNEITNLTDPHPWYHCAGKENAADFLSRGLSADCLVSNSRWWTGAEFLSDSEFPKNFQQVVPELDYLTEHEKETVVQERKKLPEADRSEETVLLNDGEGIVRVGGRLENASVPYLHKHPAILPKGSKLSKLYFNSLHTRLFHVGPQGLLNAVRHKLWPLSGHNIAHKTVHQCVTCFKSRPILSSQIMGNLSSERINISSPFTIAGLDSCGPFLFKYKNQRKETLNKVYICVCLCFSMKAIHLELLSDLTSNALIATLKRFTSRRGKCFKIYTDNTTNFVGANSILKKFHKLINFPDENLAKYFVSENIDWKFIPPKSPHFGGLWEAGVKSVKRHLKRAIGNLHFTFEEFETIMIQVEGILNSRPLTSLPSDADNFDVLTPVTF